VGREEWKSALYQLLHWKAKANVMQMESNRFVEKIHKAALNLAQGKGESFDTSICQRACASSCAGLLHRQTGKQSCRS
jgi:hypothetical protein